MKGASTRISAVSGQRFRYYLKKHEYQPAEYITAAEPQGRGAWHLHCLFLFPEKAPFIPNADMARIWGHGFTKTKSLQGIDNPGLYLTASGRYGIIGSTPRRKCKRTDSRGGNNRRTRQAPKESNYQRGAAASVPARLNLYRASRDVKRPEIWQTTEVEAQALVHGAPLTYEKTISITDEAGAVKKHYQLSTIQ